MKNVKATFHFFKAGQGAFYGGKVSYGEGFNSQFTIVYDCGTSPWVTGCGQSLKNEIDEAQKLLDAKIDILFISHLDYDHVSGLRLLMGKNTKIEKVFLPHLSEPEKLISMLSITEADDTDDLLSVDDYRTLVMNPEEFFGNTLIELISKDSAEYSSDQIKINGILRNNYRIPLEGVWEFVVFHLGAPKNLGKCLLSEIYEIVEPEKRNVQGIAEKLSDHNFRREVRSIYCKHIGNINLNGLLLLHGPDLTQNQTSFISHTFLVGDSGILQSTIELYPQNFTSRLREVAIFQFPHHGSSKSWGPAVEEKIFPNRFPPYGICNYGDGNQYGHPTQDIQSHNNFYANTQYTDRFTYTIESENNNGVRTVSLTVGREKINSIIVRV